MISIVNDKYQYILFYSAKAGSTSLRLLYLLMHKDEFTEEQSERLQDYHNLNQLHLYNPNADYSCYTKFLITRNPYLRAVSAYLDQYVYARNEGVEQMIYENPPQGSMPDNFIEFLEYLSAVADANRDVHFQTQAYFVQVSKIVLKENWLSRCYSRYSKKRRVLKLDRVSDIKDFKSFTHSVYEQVFKSDPVMLAKFNEKIIEVKKRNSSFYGSADFDDAGLLSVAELDQMTFSPKPQDFFRSKKARRLVEKIYATDFSLFGYGTGDVPQKMESAEAMAMPADFDWRVYLDLNQDLRANGVINERTAVRHYLEFGRFESRAFKRE